MQCPFNRFTITMTKEQAHDVSHSGSCDADVEYLLGDRCYMRQFKNIDADDIRNELREYGAWSEEDLSSDVENLRRITWIAGGNIKDGLV